MDRLAALPEDLQRALWKWWVCDVVLRTYGVRPSPRHPLCSPQLFGEVAYLAEALWSASYALSPPKEWLPLGDLSVDLKGMHFSASQTSSVLQWLDLNVEALPSHRVLKALMAEEVSLGWDDEWDDEWDDPLAEWPL